MRWAVGIGRASVRSWSGEEIGSVFVGTAAPGTVTQQRRYQASTGGEPIRSRAQFALLARAWATGRPSSVLSRRRRLPTSGPTEPVKEPLGRRHATGPDDQDSCKEIKWKKSKPSKPGHDADKARNHNEEKRRRHEASGRLQGNNGKGWRVGLRSKKSGNGMGHFVPGAGAARLSLRGVAVGGGRGRVGQELRPPNGRAVLEGGIHKLRRDRVGRRRRWRLDAKVKLFWLAFVVLDRKLRHGPLCDSPSRALGQSSNGRSRSCGLGQLVTEGWSRV